MRGMIRLQIDTEEPGRPIQTANIGHQLGGCSTGAIWYGTAQDFASRKLGAALSQIFSLTFQSRAGTRRADVSISNAVVAGWTGRDQAAVEKHIKELEEL